VPRPRRRFGQHFLTDPRILDRIAAALEGGPGDRVLEIGPGRGSLTEALLRRGARVTAIEIDWDLAAALRTRLPTVDVITADALDQDWHRLTDEPPEAVSVTGNIPYNITSPLLEKALAPPPFRQIVLLVQKEVADRIVADPGSRTYGALSVGVQAVAEVDRLFTVPSGAFSPAPKVASAVIKLSPRRPPLVPADHRAAFRRMVAGLFGFRRKQLLRGLRELTGWPSEQVKALLLRVGVEPAARPETVPVARFVALERALVDEGWGVR
jgi:16S rRNA (adenine1518-N6/adenine1519-N6)-dimethyltransferase